MGNTARRRRERERERRRRATVIGGVAAAALVAAAVVLIAVLSRSSDDGDAGPALSGLARQGQDATYRYSCVGCHGRAGEGATGPAWVGLFGSSVQLADGTTVVADRDYIVESIVEPNAKRVQGYGAMPQEAIPEADLEAIVQYIVELGPPTSTRSATAGG